MHGFHPGGLVRGKVRGIASAPALACQGALLQHEGHLTGAGPVGSLGCGHGRQQVGPWRVEVDGDVGAFDQFHHQVDLRPLRACHGAGIEQGDQAVVIQPSEHLDFFIVAAQIDGVDRVRRNDLDGHVATQELAPGPVDGSHGTVTDLLQEAIPPAQRIVKVIGAGRVRHAHLLSGPAPDGRQRASHPYDESTCRATSQRSPRDGSISDGSTPIGDAHAAALSPPPCALAPAMCHSLGPEFRTCGGVVMGLRAVR